MESITPQISPSVRDNQNLYNKLMDEAQSSPVPVLPHPVTLPTLPTLPPPLASASPEIRKSSRLNKGQTSKYDDYIPSITNHKSALSVSDYPQDLEGEGHN